jgi:hypothetical protein
MNIPRPIICGIAVSAMAWCLGLDAFSLKWLIFIVAGNYIAIK